MTAPKFLYHGTNEHCARKALSEGIRARGHHGKSNWKHTIESNPDAVYLTDAYPLYFAFNAAKEDGSERAAVIQLDMDRLPWNNQLLLVPDEDVLEQAGRGQDDVKGNMKQRTRWYRKRLKDYAGSDKWEVSLQAMGTCASLATIPPEAISRIAFVDMDKAPTLTLEAADAMICLANYRFCGPKYRNLTNRLFGLPLESNPLDFPDPPITGETPPELRQLLEGRQRYEERIAEEIAAAVQVEDFTKELAA